ncbi:unnamed protein product [Gadus morhua 'NCC']
MKWSVDVSTSNGALIVRWPGGPTWAPTLELGTARAVSSTRPGPRGRRSLSAGPSGCETAAAPSSPAHGDSHTQELHPITELPHL